MKWLYDAVAAGDEDGCLHDRGLTLVLPPLDMDVEGGSIKLECSTCGSALEEGVMYE